METETVLHVALFSGILGFVAFCASYAFHVWRSRNAANNSTPRNPSTRLFRWSVSCLGLGCVLLVVSSIWHEVKPREGVLSGAGLFTVRADNNLKLEYVTNARTVSSGDILARFRSPERRSEMAELELKRQILETQKKIVELQPLIPDGELVRRYEKCVADQRQLLASFTYLVPEHALVLREKLRDTLDKTERINSLNTRIENARREVDQATARRELAKKHLKRFKDLADDRAAAQTDLDERSTDDAVTEAEVARLRTAISNMEMERKYLQESVPAFAACASRQAEDIKREMVRVQDQLKNTENELKTSTERLSVDLKRAEQMRKQLLSQLELEIRQCQAKLEGIQDVLVVKAPYAGIVAYADPAPGAALPMAPVVIVAPQQGFRFRLRLSQAEIDSLSKADSVALGLVAPVLQRRFPGRLLRSEPLPYEPGYGLAELECMPPTETIRDLAAQDWGTHDWMLASAVKVRLLWQPPLYISPLFLPAMAMFAVGIFGLGAARIFRTRGRGERGAGYRPPSPAPAVFLTPGGLEQQTTGASVNEAENIETSDIESGAVARSLQLLGKRLCEAVKRQDVQPDLLQAVEWAIDRHHTRAIKHLGVGIDHDPELPECLSQFIEHARPKAPDDPKVANSDLLTDRVLRIFQMVTPGVLMRARIMSYLTDAHHETVTTTSEQHPGIHRASKEPVG